MSLEGVVRVLKEQNAAALEETVQLLHQQNKTVQQLAEALHGLQDQVCGPGPS
jgi:hypothetical protein